MGNTNQLLLRLSDDVMDRLRPDLHLVTMKHGKVLHSPGESIDFLYFPLSCMISITKTMMDGGTVEIGAIGSRELLGINAFMGGRETTHTEYIVQLSGDALRISAKPLRLEFDTNAEFRGVMLKYTQALIAQISQNVACNRLHDLENRSARWLLEVRDRVQADEFELTQEFIGDMLGVNRSTVSKALANLKEKGFINYARGRMHILDLPGLDADACECYSDLQDEFNRLLGPPPDKSKASPSASD